jgi:hypothetical protein
MSCIAAYTPNGVQLLLSCICSNGLRHHHNYDAKIQKRFKTDTIFREKTHFPIGTFFSAHQKYRKSEKDLEL